MISAKGLIYRTKNTLELLKTCPEDSPLVVQVYGSEPATIGKAASILLGEGFRFFDLNCGCSVKKVIKTGSGSALLKNTDLIVEMALTMIDAAGPGQTGIKIRLGWNNDSHVYLELAEKLAQSGIGWITLHPRTASQLFSGRASWQALKDLKQSTSIPIIASGDLFTAKDAIQCVKQTNVDNIMFARGALNNPSIFREYLHLRAGSDIHGISHANLKNMCLKTLELFQQYQPSHKSVLKMRNILPRMLRDFPGAKELRKAIIECKSWEDITRIVKRIS